MFKIHWFLYLIDEWLGDSTLSRCEHVLTSLVSDTCLWKCWYFIGFQKKGCEGSGSPNARASEMLVFHWFEILSGNKAWILKSVPDLLGQFAIDHVGISLVSKTCCDSGQGTC